MRRYQKQQLEGFPSGFLGFVCKIEQSKWLFYEMYFYRHFGFSSLSSPCQMPYSCCLVPTQYHTHSHTPSTCYLISLASARPKHSRLRQDLVNFQVPLTKTTQGWLACFKDSKNVMHEILAKRAWMGSASEHYRFGSILANWQELAMLPSMALPHPIC